MAALLAVDIDEADARRILDTLEAQYGEALPVYEGLRHSTGGRQETEYRRELIHYFEETPLFGHEKAALGDLYVWPRVLWASPKRLSRRPNTVGDLRSLINDWIGGSEPSPIKLVMGGPGSGKSSFARAMSAVLASSEAVLPVLIPLHRSDLVFNDIVKEIDTFLRRHTPLRHGLSSTAAERRIYIFDGLDELVLPEGEPMRKIARAFARCLRSMAAAEPEDRMIVLGRTAMMEEFQRHITIDTQDILHLAGLAELNSSVIIDQNHGRQNIRLDQRPTWWRNYARISGEDAEVPELFGALEFEEITDEPLLCYLVALSGIHRQTVDETQRNQAGLYARLIDAIWERSWGAKTAGPLDGPRVGVQSELSQRAFNALLEAVAYSAWRDGSMRVATYKSFVAVREELDLGDAWDAFERDMASDLASLALTFYFRGAEHERGFEFTHQTFAEFLLARLVFGRFCALCRRHGRRDAAAEDLLLDWLLFVGGAALTGNTISFLPMLAATQSSSDVAALSSVGLELLNRIITDGLPTHRLPPGRCASGKEVERWETQGQATFLNCLSALAQRRESTEALTVSWPTQLAASEFLARFTTERIADGAENLGIAGLSFEMEAPTAPAAGADPLPRPRVGTGALLSGIFLAGANLSASGFQRATLDRASFAGASAIFTAFVEARISLSDFTNAVIMNADFSGAEGTKADFQSAEIRDTSFKRFQGEEVFFSHATIENCDFTGAVLPDSRFSEATLRNVDFSEAELDGAVFSGVADFEGVRFLRARLTDADFTNCDLRKADLRGANVLNAVFDGARLPENFAEVTVSREPEDEEDNPDDEEV